VADTWQYLVSFGDLRTGDLIGGPMPVTGGSFANTLNDAGSASGLTLNLADSSLKGVNVRLLTSPARRFVFIEYGPKDGLMRPVFAGPIWSQSYSRATRKVTLSAAGLSSIFDHRKIVAALGADPKVAKTNVSFQHYSLAGLAVALVKQAQTYIGGELPISLPAVTPGGIHNRQWFGWELHWAGELLDSITNVKDGPDIEFRPRRQPQDPSKVEWVMRVGDEGSPELHQDGPRHTWDDTVVDSGVLNLTSDSDGSQMGTRVWVPGDGIESDRIVGSMEDLDLVQAGYPMLDAEDTSRTSVTNENGTSEPITKQATLDQYAAELIRSRSRPQETWTITVAADRYPQLGTYFPGDYATIALRGDPFLPDGAHEVRIVELSGGMDHQVSVTMSPTEGLV
jgi:hypothetical protein